MRGLPPQCRMIHKTASVGLSDISGFTALTEKLMKKGDVGAETITEIVNTIFSEFIDTILGMGGDIIHFSGDAITFAVYEDLFQDHEERAALITLELYKKLSSMKNRIKAAYKTDLGMHSSLHSGGFEIFLSQESDPGYFCYSGSAIQAAADLLDRSQEGEIIISNEMAGNVPGIEVKGKNGNLFLLSIKGQKTPYRVETQGNIPALLVDVNIRNAVEQGVQGIDQLNGHRHAVVIFITFDQIDSKTGLPSSTFFHIMSLLVEELKRYGGYLDKFDFSADGEKLMLVFGAPVALKSPEYSGARFLLELKRTLMAENINFTASLHSGWLFTGVMGNQRRMEFTVMGDTVNTTARLLALAEKNEITCSAIVEKCLKSNFTFASKGKFSVKGKRAQLEAHTLLDIQADSGPPYDDKDISAFVGRKSEISSAVRGLSGKEPESIMISGQSGSGKSFLLSRIYKEISGRVSRLFIKHRLHEKQTDYLGIKKVIHHFLELSTERDFSGAEENYKKLSILCGLEYSETRAFFKLINPPVGETPSRVARESINLSWLKLFDHFKQKSNLVLFMDDIQYCDEKSVGLLKWTCDITASMAIIAAGIEIPKDLKGIICIEMEPFGKREIDLLIYRLFESKEIVRVLSGKVMALARGIPLLTREYLELLMKNKTIEFRKGRWEIHTSELSLTTSNASSEIILGQFDILSSKLKEFIRFGAIAPEFFDMTSYFSLNENHVNDFSFVQDEVRFIFSEKGHYYFRNSSTRDIIYNSTPYKTREILHSRIAAMISAGKLKGGKDALALHLFKAGDLERALPLMIGLASDNRDNDSYENALSYYKMALVMVNKLPENSLKHLELPFEGV